MWQYAMVTFFDAPLLGNGAGNAINHMSAVADVAFSEDNVHLYCLQVLLDFGLVGFLVFFAMVVSFIKHCASTKIASPFSAYLLIYLVASFVQFSGGDVLVGFALGGLFLELDEVKKLRAKTTTICFGPRLSKPLDEGNMPNNSCSSKHSKH